MARLEEIHPQWCPRRLREQGDAVADDLGYSRMYRVSAFLCLSMDVGWIKLNMIRSSGSSNEVYEVLYTLYFAVGRMGLGAERSEHRK